MKFLPTTRQVELDQSSPENLIYASSGTLFYRVGNDLFYLIQGISRQRIEVRKKAFVVKYNNQIWYPKITDSSIIFKNQYEVWQKTGYGYSSSGWKFLSYNAIDTFSSEPLTPTPTPTPTIAPTPTPTPTPIGPIGLYRTIYSGYFADNPSWFDTATQIISTINTGSIQIGGFGGDQFSVQWVGYFRPDTTENYTFYIDSDDASFMWIGDGAIAGYTTSSALIANPEIHAPRERSGSVSLVAGNVYPIRIQYGEHFGGEVFVCSFSTNTIAKTTDMTNRIFYIPFPTPTPTPAPTDTPTPTPTPI